MAHLAIDTQEPSVIEGIAEIQRLILAAFPEARFSVELGEDPVGTYLIATVDSAETDDVIDVYIDRLIELQVEDGLKLHVLPLSGPSQGHVTV